MDTNKKANNDSFMNLDLQRLSNVLQFIMPFLLIAGLWELLVRLDAIDAQILPAPSVILKEIYVLLFKKQVLQNQHL